MIVWKRGQTWHHTYLMCWPNSEVILYFIPTADIARAFHQISIDPADRDKLRFLWFKKTEEEIPKIVQYRFFRLVFGLTSSPAILDGTIQHHLSHHKQPELQVAEMYVDDFTGGASNDETGVHFMCIRRERESCKKGVSTFANGVQTHTFWIKELQGREGQHEHKPEAKILGLKWDTVNDAFRFDFAEVVEYLKSLPTTERYVCRVQENYYLIHSGYLVHLQWTWRCSSKNCAQTKGQTGSPFWGENAEKTETAPLWIWSINRQDFRSQVAFHE